MFQMSHEITGFMAKMTHKNNDSLNNQCSWLRDHVLHVELHDNWCKETKRVLITRCKQLDDHQLSKFIAHTFWFVKNTIANLVKDLDFSLPKH